MGAWHGNVKAFKVEIFPGACPYIDDSCSNIVQLLEAELSDGEVGNQIILELIEIDEEELRNLPEWSGP